MPKVVSLDDFSGGYATDLTPERMSENMLLTAENVMWNEGLVGRTGKQTYSTCTTASAFRGMERCYLSSGWVTVEAMDNGTDVRFLISNSTGAKTTVSGSTVFQTAYNVQMAQLGDYVVAVNGYNRPQVVYYSTASTYAISALDVYDIRTVSSWDWYAGVYLSSGTTQYFDYSSEAYNATTGDFPIAGTTIATNGFYVTADQPFSRVVLTSCSLMDQAVNVSYLTSGGWTTVSTASGYVETTAYSTMFQAAGSYTLDLDYIPDWTNTHGSTIALLANKYALKVAHANALTSAAYCQKLQVYDRHYLTRVLGDDRPSCVTAHNNRIWLSAGNNVNWSPYNKITDWDVLSQEYFTEGGQNILALVSHVDYLLVLKEGALWGFLTASFENLTKRKLSNIGCISGRSVAVVNQLAFFMASDGIRMWTGENNVLISKHIKSDLDSWTVTNACGIAYKGYYYIAFPTNGKILIFDPDTYRTDDAGDGRVSFFKFTTPRIDQFNWNSGAGDNGYLMGISNETVPLIVRLMNGNNYDDADIPFQQIARTKYHSFGQAGYKKIQRRLKPYILGPAPYTLTMSPDHGTSQTTEVSMTLASTVSGIWSEDVSVPYTMDGVNLSLEIKNKFTSYDWWAGARFSTGTTQYVDYTSEAVSATTGDFPICGTTKTSDGCYFIADGAFNRITFTSAAIATTAVPKWSYLSATNVWTTMSTADYIYTSAYQSTWATAGDHTIDFETIPTWTSTHGSSFATLSGKYAMRMTFTTAPTTAALYCKKVDVYDHHTTYSQYRVIGITADVDKRRY